MHKDKLKIYSMCFILAIAIVLCIIKHNQFLEIKDKEFRIKEEYSNLKKIKTDISSLNFCMLRKDILCFSKVDNIRDTIKKISDSSRIQDILFKEISSENEYFKMKDIELKFLSKKEKYIYDFINNLMEIPNVLVHFNDIKITKSEKNILKASIKCKLFLIKKHKHQKLVSLNITNKKDNRLLKQIRLFPNNDYTPRYTLYCILGKMAFINDVWMNIGDENDNFAIKDIDYSHIIIKKDKKIIRVKIGEMW